MSIVGMAVGKYYSQSKLNTLLRQRKAPEVQYLDEDSVEVVSVHFLQVYYFLCT